MLKGFRDFIARGNVVDLAVAVVIGAAFTTVVNSVVENLINPLIGLIFNAENLKDLAWGPIGIGAIIAAIINFVAVAAVVYFVFVLPMNKYNERRAAKSPVEESPELPSEQELLVEIRDLLRKS